MKRSYYVETNDPEYVVKIGENGAEVVFRTLPIGLFSLVNTLTPAAMNEARDAAKAKGFRLFNPRLMATTNDSEG